MTNKEDFVPKTHPATRNVESEDPMMLVANSVSGDPDWMIECMLDEFFWMGYGECELFELFQSPAYPVLNQLLAHFGEDCVRSRFAEICGRAGVLRFRESIAEVPSDFDDEEDLVFVPLGIPVDMIQQNHESATAMQPAGQLEPATYLERD